jgi:hypothetical protein
MSEATEMSSTVINVPRPSAIDVRLDNIEKTLDKIDAALNGSGNGLLERIVKLEAKTSGAWRTIEILGWIATFLLALYGVAGRVKL